MKGYYSRNKFSKIVDVAVLTLKKWNDDGFIVPDKTPLGDYKYNNTHIDFILSDDFLAKRNEFYKNRGGINEE